MAATQNLILMPPNRLDAFAATGVLADMLRAEPARGAHIMCHAAQVPFFQDAPGRINFISYPSAQGASLSAMMQLMGRRWNRIIGLTQQKLPFFLWARHRHIFRYQPESYALPSLLAPERATAPHIWIPEKLFLALPETLSPDTPLVVFATGEHLRADWDYRHYAELAWRLADSVPQLAAAHIVVLAQKNCPLAGALMANLPAGQITRFDDLAYAKQAAVLRRAHIVIGTDRLVARMAPYAGANLVLRLDRDDSPQAGRPYGLYGGADAAQVAVYVQGLLAQIERPAARADEHPQSAPEAATNAARFAKTESQPMSAMDMRRMAAQIDRINNDE